MRYSSDETMSHFLKFDSLIRELKFTDDKLKNSDIVYHLLLIMPAQYDVFVTTLETLSSEQLTLSLKRDCSIRKQSVALQATIENRESHRQCSPPC